MTSAGDSHADPWTAFGVGVLGDEIAWFALATLAAFAVLVPR